MAFQSRADCNQTVLPVKSRVRLELLFQICLLGRVEAQEKSRDSAGMGNSCTRMDLDADQRKNIKMSTLLPLPGTLMNFTACAEKNQLPVAQSASVEAEALYKPPFDLTF